MGVGRHIFLSKDWTYVRPAVLIQKGRLFDLFRVRISHQPSLFELRFGCDVRKLSQILIETNRTDHLHYVGSLCAGGVLVGSGAIGLLDGLWAISLANSATAMPRRQSAEAIKMRRLKKADFEVDFFFMDEVELFPSPVAEPGK